MRQGHIKGRISDPEQRHILEHFHKAAAILGQATDLTPANENVSRCLKDFVQAVLDCRTSARHTPLLDRADVRALRAPLLQKLSEAEFQMELFYAQPGRLASFPYHDNYRDLVAEELRALGGALPEGDIYFIGSGPLPLTAVECARQTGRSVICVEKDPAAASLSRRVIAELGLAEKLRVCEADGADCDYRGAGLVMIAALVDGKDVTLAKIQNAAPGAMIGIRSAEGLRTLLYDAVDPQEVTRKGYHLASQTRATPSIVNTTLFFVPRQVCAAQGTVPPVKALIAAP